MKTKILAAVIILILAFGCTSLEKETAKGLLTDPKLRADLFTEIAGNESYMAEFTAQMSANENCRKVCVNNVSVMKTAWESEKMDSMLEREPLMVEIMVRRMIRQMRKDSVICRNVCDAAMENERFKMQMLKSLKGK